MERRRGGLVVAAALALIFGAVGSGIGIAGLSVNASIGADRAAAAVARRLAGDPVIQARVRDGVVTALVSAVPILGTFRSTLSEIVGSMAGQPGLQAVLKVAIRRSIAELLDGRSSQVTLSLDDIREPLVAALGGSVVAGLLPPPDSSGRIVVMDAAAVKHLRQVRAIGARTAAVLLVFGIALLGAGVALADRWRLVAIGVGAASLAAVALMVPPIAAAIREGATASIADPVGRVAAQAVWAVTAHDLSTRMGALASIAATAALVAFAAAGFRRVRRARRSTVAVFEP